jgi:hypothetical protein
MSSLPNPNREKDYVAFSIKDSSISYPPSSKLFCNLCNCKLVLFDAQKEEWYCSRCNISYFPNKGERVKRANKFETPGPNVDIHGNIIGDKAPIVSMVIDKKESSSSYSNPKLPRSFQEMERHGLKITSYTTTEVDK